MKPIDPLQDVYNYGNYISQLVKSITSMPRDPAGRITPPNRLPPNSLCVPVFNPIRPADTMLHSLRSGVDTTGVPRSFGLSEEGATRLSPVFTPLYCEAFPRPPYNHGGH